MASALNRSDYHKYSHQDGQMMKQLYDDVLEENVRSYTAHKIIDISINESPQIRTITKEKQDDIYNEINPHVKRLKQYNDDVTHINRKFSDYKELNQLKAQVLAIDETPKYPEFEEKSDSLIFDEDEEKKIELSVDRSEELYEPFVGKTRGDNGASEYYGWDGMILLRQSTNLSNMVTAQQARTDVIDEYTVPLNETTIELKQIVKRYKKEVETANSKFIEIDISYEEIKTKRISLQEWIEQLMTELNETIDVENRTNQKRKQIKTECEILKLEQIEFEKLLKQSKKNMKKYEKYMGDVESATNKISEYFGTQMGLHERNWTKWTSEDVSNYIKFLNQTECENKIKLSNNIDLEAVTKGIKEQGVTGFKLDRMQKNDWFPIGVQWLEDRNIIHGKIQALVEKYPREPIEPRDPIPTKFKCSISGEIMMNPVLCSDNKIYDKQTVLQYIKENDFKLPGAVDEYDEDDVMITMRALKKEIAQFLSEHPNCRQ